MSEHEQLQTHSSAGTAQEESEVVVLIKKMQQQLAFLEKKIDTLISQSSERPSFRERHFSKPRGGSFGHFQRHGQGHGHGHGRGQREDRPRERPFGEGLRQGQVHPRQHFDRPQGEEQRGFSRRKKPKHWSHS